MKRGEPNQDAGGRKKHAPAAARNSAPIAEALRDILPDQGTVLEIASGSGEHALFFAREFPHLSWQPSDPDPEALASIAAWREERGPANLAAPLTIDASSSPWPMSEAAAVLCINMVHISPWEATCGLFESSASLLDEGSPLILYGPYFEAEVEAAPSNVEFDLGLRARNPQWGVRSRDEIDRLAKKSGFALARRIEMPANNLMLVFRRT